jgi:predicted MFS family arabinose efflux permease
VSIRLRAACDSIRLMTENSSASLPAPGNADAEVRGITPGLVVLFAIACGLAVGNIYYAQPLLDTLGHDFHARQSLVGLIVTMTQIGYAVGLLTIVPLGDLIENKKLVLLVFCGTVASLLLAALSPGIRVFFIASLLIGITSVVAQVLIPLAAALTPQARRGQVVGQIMSGLLLGILFARALSGFIAGTFGWRAVYFGSATLLVALMVVLARKLPERKPTFNGTYGELIASLYHIFRNEPVLRRRAFYQTAMFASFSAFWTTITFLLAGPFHFTQTLIGFFALAGAAGAIVAPLAGKLGDRGYQRPATGAAFVVAMIGYLLTLHAAHWWTLILAAIIIDAAVQTTLVCGQQMIYSLHPEQRSRLNTLFIATFFLGGAAGSAIASYGYERIGWSAVVVIGVALSLLALAYWLTEPKTANAPSHN